MSGFSAFDDEFEGQSSKRKSAATVPDGDYTVEIKLAELRETKAGDVFSFKMVVLDDGPLSGKQIERALFLTPKGESEDERAENRKKKVGELKVDLATIGFDVDNWTKANNRPFGSQCELACRLMKGCKVQVRAKTNNNYQNVYINKRLEDGKPTKFGAAEMAAVQTDENVPFTADPEPNIPF